MLARVRACSLSPSFSLSPVKKECAGVLYAFKCAHTLFTGQRERREREREREGERERCRICPELLFLFLKGMTSALAPFSYLVFNSHQLL